MTNSLVLIGRISSEIKLIDNKNTIELILAVNRYFKNEQGIYETDFIPCTIYGSSAISTKEYCQKGDLIGLKGELRMENNELKVFADKVSYLSMAKKEEE